MVACDLASQLETNDLDTDGCRARCDRYLEKSIKAHASADAQKAAMSKNVLYLLVGALLVAVIGLGIYVYREQSKPKDGVEINIGKDGVSVEGN